jgi:23S rRNA pseudouridine2604 synthase
MTESIRLAKRVAALVPCSRREAELYIEGGWVRVNGVVVEQPQHRVTDERIELDPGATLAALEPVTLLLHKPAGATNEQARQLLSPDSRMAGDPSGLRTVRHHFAQLVPLMPLPAQASGLAVFSQEPRIIRRLTEDATTLEQELVADVAGDAAPDALARLCHGLVFQGRALPPIKVSWQNETRLRFALKGIAPELLPWMGEQVGLRVLALKRIRIGRLPMAGLPAGRWRYLQPHERF